MNNIPVNNEKITFEKLAVVQVHILVACKKTVRYSWCHKLLTMHCILFTTYI